jgi:naphthoate synthase
MEFEDILYEKKQGVAKITINRPEVLNAFRIKTLEEISAALLDADENYPEIGVVVITGAGDKSFCTGGDAREKGKKGVYLRGMIMIHARALDLIRKIQQPVIAAVNGYALGGGHVLQTACDLCIASETATFGQTGPRSGSFDAGNGASFLARLVGERKAREIWYLCRQYTAQEAQQMCLVNKVVPPPKLEEEVAAWCDEILAKSPTAIKGLKAAFNAQAGFSMGTTLMGDEMTWNYWNSDEAFEGRRAFEERRLPDFSRFRG